MLRSIGLLAVAMSARAQSAPPPKFEVASVKACDPHIEAGHNAGTSGRGMVAYNCQPLMNYIRTAYGRWANGRLVPGNAVIHIEGGPAWVNTELYQIAAKAEGAPSVGMTAGPMMQALLEERFHLKIRRETREVPAYALVAAKGGPRLPAAKVGCFTMEPGQPRPQLEPGQPLPPRCGWGTATWDGIEVHGATMADFCLALAGLPLVVDPRKFVDKTGIAGQFDFDLKWSAEDFAAAPSSAAGTTGNAADPAGDLPRLQRALRKVGLQLTPAKGPEEFLVIDHVERPSAN